MKKFKFQRFPLAHIAHVPENTGVENCAPSSHNCACSLKKEERNATCAIVRNTCAIANPNVINNVRNMRNMRRGTDTNIPKISFPMDGKDLIEFKRLSETGVQFDFPEENPVIPLWSQIVSSNTDGDAQPTRCYCCGSQTFWRKKDNQGGRWICEVCHPPVLSKDEIVWHDQCN